MNLINNAQNAFDQTRQQKRKQATSGDLQCMKFRQWQSQLFYFDAMIERNQLRCYGYTANTANMHAIAC